MSLFESNESNGDISTISQLEIEDIAQAIVRGGWPASVTSKAGSAEKRVQDYVDSVVNFDVSHHTILPQCAPKTVRDRRPGSLESFRTIKNTTKSKSKTTFCGFIDTEKMNKPSFLMIVTGSKLGYKRDDGALVVPLDV